MVFDFAIFSSSISLSQQTSGGIKKREEALIS